MINHSAELTFDDPVTVSDLTTFLLNSDIPANARVSFTTKWVGYGPNESEVIGGMKVSWST